MPEIKLKNLRGKEVIYVDLREINATKPEGQALFDRLIDEVITKLKTYRGDVLLMYDVRGSYANRNTMKKLKEITEILTERNLTAKKAIVGIEGMKKVLLNSANLLFGSSVKPFDTDTEAEDYLLK